MTVPLLAAVYAPLIEFCDFSIHIYGKSGGHKSELAARAMQHYGAGYTRLKLPGNWGSTANSLEMLCFAAKDMPVVIDQLRAGQLVEKQARGTRIKSCTPDSRAR